MEMGSVSKTETILVLSVSARWDFIIIVLYLFIRYKVKKLYHLICTVTITISAKNQLEYKITFFLTFMINLHTCTH